MNRRTNPNAVDRKDVGRSPRRNRRRVGATLFLAFLLIGVCVYWATNGRTPRRRVGRIASCSMEPAFDGPGLRWRCPRCDRSFRTALNLTPNIEVLGSDSPNRVAVSEADALVADSVRRSRLKYRSFLCPFCGESVSSETTVFVRGDAVELEPFGDRLERFAPVFFVDSRGRLQLKRLIGFPGETVSLFQGDVYINGTIARKPPDVQRKTLCPITSLETFRWNGRVLGICLDRIAFEQASRSENVVADGGTDGIAFPQNDDSSAFATSRDGRTFDLNELLSRFAVPLDNRPCDPVLNARPCCEIENVRDFVLRFDYAEPNGERSSPLPILVRFGNDVWLWTFNFRSERLRIDRTTTGEPIWTATSNDFQGEPFGEFRLPPAVRAALNDGASVSLAIGYCDRRFSLSVFDEPAFCVDLPTDDLVEATRTSEKLPPVVLPFVVWESGIGSNSATGELRNIRLFRDVHYSNVSAEFESSSAEPSVRSWRVPDGRYFLLGDNSPFSLDGRLGEPSFVAERDLRGSVAND